MFFYCNGLDFYCHVDLLYFCKRVTELIFKELHQWWSNKLGWFLLVISHEASKIGPGRGDKSSTWPWKKQHDLIHLAKLCVKSGDVTQKKWITISSILIGIILLSQNVQIVSHITVWFQIYRIECFETPSIHHTNLTNASLHGRFRQFANPCMIQNNFIIKMLQL